MHKVSRKVTSTILSMSLLTVMAGAAIAPALGIIKEHFSTESSLLVQFIVSVPALFIIITSLFFLTISRHFKTRAIAITGLTLYIVAGTGCFFIRDIYVLLALRALLGVSVGLIMPLSTGLLSFYFPPEDQARLMGLSGAMNQLGGVVATLIAGLLANIQWNYAFLVYLLGIIVIIMVIAFLPDGKLGSSNKRGKAFEPRQLLKFHPSVIGMFLLMMIFFIYPTNFAIITHAQTTLSTNAITLIMVGMDIVATIAGMCFGRMMTAFRRTIKYMAPVLFLLAYTSFIYADSLSVLAIGTVLAGIAMGVGVPYLNTIASIKGGRNSATTVMPLLSAAMYLGQFLSPVIVTPLSHTLFRGDITGAYKTGVALSFIFLLQVWSTRHFQSLPPTQKGVRN